MQVVEAGAAIRTGRRWLDGHVRLALRDPVLGALQPPGMAYVEVQGLLTLVAGLQIQMAKVGGSRAGSVGQADL